MNRLCVFVFQTIAFLAAILAKTSGAVDAKRKFPMAADDCKQVPAVGLWL